MRATSTMRLFMVCLSVSFIFAASSTNQQTSNPQIIYLSGVLRDQAPMQMASTNHGSCGTANNTKGFWDTDFQWMNNGDQGIVGKACNAQNGWNPPACAAIGTDQTPIYASSGLSPSGTVHGPASFYTWFHDSPKTITVPIQIPLGLTTQGNHDVYYYKNESFFPLDGLGWKDSSWNNQNISHNYAFCLEAHSRFGYQGGEVFTFTGDDDVFVFLDNRLMLDLGGVHGPNSGSITIDQIPGFVVGNNYRFDIFYCERHTQGSDLTITTSLSFYCSYYDWCGVCEGNGQSCCTQQMVAQYCDDKNPCTVDGCPVLSSPQKGNCTHTPLQCAPPNKCQTQSCGGNVCVYNAITCEDNDPCTDNGCDPNSGCIFTPKNCNDNNACTDDSCAAGTGKCLHTTTNCDDSNACTIDTCNTTTGCAHATKSCDDSNACTRDTCDTVKGCANTDITATCADQSACTRDFCDQTLGCQNVQITCNSKNACINDGCSATSGCTTSPVNCNTTNQCLTASCSSTKGCQYAAVVCDDKNACTDDSCDINKGCKFTPKNCDDSDPCTNDGCDVTSGCTHSKVNCDDNNACTQDGCDAAHNGCYNTNTTSSCIGTDACFIYGCDTQSGCTKVPKNCDDNSRCTDDTCDSVKGCIHTTVNCDDNTLCTNDFCSPTDGCYHTTVNCDDGMACTDDTCTASAGCLHTIKTCTAPDSCHTASCSNVSGCAYAVKNCDDGDACTDDSCDPSTANGCVHTTRNCDDGNKCHINSCDSKFGCTTANKTCPDMGKCMITSCSAGSGCQYTPVVCDDKNSCTVDSCDNSTGCSFIPKNCNDNDACTQDSCDQSKPFSTSCVNTPISCDKCKIPATVDCSKNGTKCSPYACAPENGTCVPLPKINCDDNNACTDDQCSLVDGTCLHTQHNCPADNKCMIASCDVTKGCSQAPKDCDDGNPCTIDSCISSNGTCVNTPVAGFCITCGGSKCQYSDACSPLTCVNNQCVQKNVSCDDNNKCTTDMCNSTSGKAVCEHTSVTCPTTDLCNPASCDAMQGCINTAIVCNDNNLCTNDTCVSGQCPFTPLPCSSPDPCKVAQCSAKGGCQISDKVCNDFDPCTTDSCGLDGTCVFQRNDMCTSCAGSACTWTDPCNPNSCQNGKCLPKPVDCDDGNACTDDSCSGNGSKYTCQHNTITCTSNDACFPATCDSKTGCGNTTVNCDDGNKCTSDSCSNGVCSHDFKSCDGTTLCNQRSCQPSTGDCVDNDISCDDKNPCTVDSCLNDSGNCSFVPMTCDNSDPCNPQTCMGGKCVASPVNCDDHNGCTLDSCINVKGVAQCSNAVISCPVDPCNPTTCNSSNGKCEAVPFVCDDHNPCTVDAVVCNTTGLSCNFTYNDALCEDNNVCTNDVCLANGDQQCNHTAIVCPAPFACEEITGCDPVKGCQYSKKTCPPSEDLCKVATCDKLAGCILTPVVCNATDVNCFDAHCENGKCVKTKKDGFNTRESSTSGVTCALKYTDTTTKVIIGAGAAAGIAVGAAAGAGILGYGGKKGYDIYQASQAFKDSAVQDNPLYEQSTANSENPLYEGGSA